MVSESLRFCVESLYLATGGADLIGSHIVDELVRRGERVRVLGDFSAGHHENLAEARPHTAAVGRPRRRTYGEGGGGVAVQLRGGFDGISRPFR